jgi:hypothetical protein
VGRYEYVSRRNDGTTPGRFRDLRRARFSSSPRARQAKQSIRNESERYWTIVARPGLFLAPNARLRVVFVGWFAELSYFAASKSRHTELMQ